MEFLELVLYSFQGPILTKRERPWQLQQEMAVKIYIAPQQKSESVMLKSLLIVEAWEPSQ